MISYKNIYISSLGAYVPEKVVTNEEIIQKNQLKMKSSWIEGRLGIKERRWASEDQAASDLALLAMKKLGSISEQPLFLSTISQDYLTPTTSSELKRKLKWTGNSLAVDCSASCAGLIFAMTLASNHLLATDDKGAYAVATEVRSRFLNQQDRRTVFLFADAACAMGLTKNPTGAIARLDWAFPQTLAQSEAEIYIPAGGSKEPINEMNLKEGRQYINMRDGSKIEETIDQFLVEKITGALSLRGEQISDYGFVVLHQGHAQLIYKLCENLGLRKDQTEVIFDTYGNSTSASVGVALHKAKEKGLLKKQMKVLMVAMGAGYNLGLAGLTWNV